MLKKIVICVIALSLSVGVLSACGKKKTNVLNTSPTPSATTSATPSATTSANTVSSSVASAESSSNIAAQKAAAAKATPAVSKEESKKIQQEQQQVVTQAKEQAKEAEKKVAEKVVTSSVAVSAPIPDGFPVTTIPIIQGAQIVSASKSGDSNYNMVLRVNIPAADAYKYYYDIYDVTGSVVKKTDGKSITMERTKNAIKADMTFANENEKTSTVTIKATVAK